MLLLALVEQFLRAEAGIGPPVGEQLLHGGLVEVGPLALPVGTVVAANVGTFVGLQPEPGQIVDDAGVVVARGALEVGVLDAQHQGAAVMAGVEEVVERRAGAAHVQRTRGTGSEAYAYVGHADVSLARFSSSKSSAISLPDGAGGRRRHRNRVKALYSQWCGQGGFDRHGAGAR